MSIKAKKKLLLMASLLGLLPLAGQAQMSGNQVLSSRSRYRAGAEGSPVALLPDRLMLTDSTFVVGANVMQHVRADHYVAVFGLRLGEPPWQPPKRGLLGGYSGLQLAYGALI